MKNSRAARISIVLMLSCACSQKPAQNPETEALDKLAGDFWTWRAKYAPFTGDDVNRIEHPGGTRDWSAAAIDKQRKDLAEFAARWKKIDVKGWPVPKQVDYKLIPYSPQELLAMDRQEWDRAVAFEAFEKERNRNVPPLKLAANTDSWIKEAAAKELSIREFLEKHGILTVPNWVQHYTLRPMPPYLHALEGFGETDDFTSTSRLKDNCVRYVDPPSGNLGYFWRATAEDPRPIAVHEGIPGHYFQLCLSWKHEDPIRRHYYDSGANEGIGFYAEEMMLQAGLFDDSPRTREIIYNFMRLRALRVEVDVNLALGEFTLEQAAKYLEQKVPMDANTARQEAIAFSTGPGQAITYQIGKLQIMKFLAEARMLQGDKFNLRAFHDFVWKNGNVPIALQRWEYLGATDR